MAQNDRQKILDCLQYFFDGFDAYDGNLVRKAFHESAWLYNPARNDGNGYPLAVLCDELLPAAKADPSHLWHRETCKKNVPLIDITGDAAVAKVEWIFSEYTMTDYYTLLKKDDRWYIINKIWHTDYH